MASNGGHRGGLLKAGGVLSIVAGACEIYSGGVMMAAFANPGVCFSLWGFGLLTFRPGFRSGDIISWGGGMLFVEYSWLIIIGVLLFVLGIIAMAGGISAIRRKRFGLSLVGAICALPSVILGIPAVIFVALRKREFGVED
jgi:hypothetical protein